MKKILLVIISILIIAVLVSAQGTPTSTRDLISKLGNPATVNQYRNSVPGGNILFAPGNNLYLRNYRGGFEFYTLLSNPVVLVRGINLRPPTEVYITERAGDHIIRTGNACVALNYMNSGELAIRGRSARTAVAAIRAMCRAQPGTPQFTPPACNNQKLGDHCGSGSCGPGTTGTCQAGLVCNTAISRCAWPAPPTPQVDNGYQCSSSTQCKSGSCIWDHNQDKFVCAGPREPGQICAHAGECRTGLHCLYYSGEGPNRVYRCSCEMFSHRTGC